jgi:uncharacterized membrane protein YfcA
LKIAIALSLFFAAATSLLGATNNLQRARCWPRERFGVVIGAMMAVWFAFAGTWLLTHH